MDGNGADKQIPHQFQRPRSLFFYALFIHFYLGKVPFSLEFKLKKKLAQTSHTLIKVRK